MLARGHGKGTLSSVVLMGLVMVAGGRWGQKEVIQADGGEPPAAGHGGRGGAPPGGKQAASRSWRRQEGVALGPPEE